ncbi:HAD family hydrolase [Paraburkholderia sp.]|uniref:HAD family hydrolase n=1 Tax=Paraburkholderia sp. TaxID=1926495 RepID=UPI0025EC6160|nr:HAD family hydrolase [Paraburkholderia sp.]
MSPILIFDLDDTLYPEKSFVDSGFRAVASWMQQQYGWDDQLSLGRMNAILSEKGRGAVFNQWLAENGVASRKAVLRCIQVYRHHMPAISLYPQARSILARLGSKPYLVTDGHKVVQYNKVKALHLENQCAKVLLTHRYGIQHEKPSTLCFQRILERERCDWTDLIYVGDNPAKDFVGLNPIGVRTIRVKTGGHANVLAKPGFDAQHTIDDLSLLPDVLPDIDWR